MAYTGIVGGAVPYSDIDFTHFAAILMSGNAEEDPTQWGFAYNDIDSGQFFGFEDGSYSSLSDLVAGLANFTGSVGLPWVAVGDPTTYPPAEHYATVLVPCAVDLSRVTGWSDSGSGINFTGLTSSSYTLQPTLGYAPWDNYSDASAGLSALQTVISSGGYFTFDGS
jgi:hypothetical protein